MNTPWSYYPIQVGRQPSKRSDLQKAQLIPGILTEQIQSILSGESVAACAYRWLPYLVNVRPIHGPDYVGWVANTCGVAPLLFMCLIRVMP